MIGGVKKVRDQSLFYFAEAPNEVIKVYRADQSSRFIFVNKDTTAGDAVKRACKEFGISDNVGDNALYKVSIGLDY